MRTRRRCATSDCRHAPRAHNEHGCTLCGCDTWLDHKAHAWREQVYEAWVLATHAWLLERERVAIGYETEQDDFEANHPRPRLADFMDAMSAGEAPERVTELSKPPVCTSCCGTGHHPRRNVA